MPNYEKQKTFYIYMQGATTQSALSIMMRHGELKACKKLFSLYTHREKWNPNPAVIGYRKPHVYILLKTT